MDEKEKKTRKVTARARDKEISAARDKEVSKEEEMPVLALRGLVLFPNMILHFDVGR